MISALSDLIREPSPVIATCRLAIAGAWLYGLARIWQFRDQPHANQALAAAVAMILSNALLVFNVPIAQDVLVFFVAMAQMVLVVSFAQVFEILKSGHLDEPRVEHSWARKAQTKILLGIGAVSLVGHFVGCLFS